MESVPPRLAAALADRYRIDREIGAGGAATVYLADDLKHDRRVALKVLRPEVAEALGVERFQDEIRIAARLHHPHILAVHDSGEADGHLYYVMPYVEGHSLRDRLQEGRRMSPSQVAKLLAEVADALAHAHAAGIVHRDIKPENILLAGRHAVVTDFGIAKAISDAGNRRSTTSMGLALGTPSYMAPEQATADPKLDHRADLYALGVIGYEMLAGHPPFSGTAQEILAAHTVKPPEPLSQLRPDVPPALSSVIMRLLAKSPGDRWQTAEAVQEQLEPLTGTSSQGGITPTLVLPASLRGQRRGRWLAAAALGVLVVGAAIGWQFWRGPGSGEQGAAPAAAGTAPGIPDLATDPSIAVLPFKNMSSDAEQEFFSDGISEELLNLLAKVPKLRVVARTSSFAYKNKDVGIQQIGRELNVASVLEGSVRKSGDKVRITVQLVRASDGTHLWSQTYDRTLEDIFAVQDEIAANVVEKLRLTLLGGSPTVRPVDPKVYPLLLQAKAVADQNTTSSRVAALSIYKRVVAMSPDEPRAHAGMARLYLNQAVQLDRPAEEALADARRAIARTLELDPDNATARSYLARIAMDFDGDLVSAARETQRVLELDPGGVGIGAAGSMLMTLGRHDQAIRLLGRRAEADPANPVAWGNLQIALGLAGKCDEAIDAGRQALALSPDYAEVHASIALCLLRSGKAKEALAEARLEPFEPSRLSTLAIIEQAMGDTRAARANRDLLARKHPVDGAVYLAAADARLGNADAAFRALDQAIVQKDAALALIANDWTFEPLHADPRWQVFLRRITRSPEQLATVKLTVPTVK